MTSNLRTKNITYDDRDTNNLKYGGFWFLDGTWNASNVGQTGTLSSSNDPDANITFTFPEPAIAFYLFGFRRSRGGLYGICIDCDVDKPNYQDIDALETTDNDNTLNPPVALFLKRFETPAQHVVILRNENDTRIAPGGNSQIAIDRFVLEVVDNPSAPTVTPFGSPPSTSASRNSEPPIGVIIGGVGGGILLAVILILLGLYYCRRHHKRHQLALAHEDVNTDPSEAGFPTIFPYSVMHPSISKEERPKAGEPRRTPQRPPSPTTSSGSTAIVAYFRFRRRQRRERLQNEINAEQRPERRREADAGPVPLEDAESTLPPLYEHVFQAGSSNRPPSGQPEPNGESQPMTAPVVQNTGK
ncbi:hypothetical protein PQX77_003011 [Marasmius sp. AFHP31]|nr:hypothetical protein PQX77_003011 [Marasmius sp. AFHP31]